MALNATVVWRVRAGGAATNGGGYDAAVSGAGTDYSDQDSPQLSITDLTSTASTTVTSALSTFTSAMVGNILRIASGTGATTGYYMITAYVSASQITLDRVSGTYTAGVAKVGGAFAAINQFANGGSGTQPTLTTPLAAGHTIYVRGAGTDDPSTADYTVTNYLQFPSGDATSGAISWIGYNGRPRIDCDALCMHILTAHKIQNFKFVPQNENNNTNGLIKANGQSVVPVTAVTNVYIDANGKNLVGIDCSFVTNCKFVNTGGTTASTLPAIQNLNNPTYTGLIAGNFISSWRGVGIKSNTSSANIVNNIITNTKGTTSNAMIVCATPAQGFGQQIMGNTLFGGSGDGIYLTNSADFLQITILNNIVMSCTGYWLNVVTGNATLNERSRPLIDYNCYNGNGNSNAAANLNAGAHDVTGDPLFTSAAGLDFTLGSSSPCKGTGWPGVAWPGAATTTQTQGYIDMGAIQRQESAGGGTNVFCVMD